MDTPHNDPNRKSSGEKAADSKAPDEKAPGENVSAENSSPGQAHRAPAPDVSEVAGGTTPSGNGGNQLWSWIVVITAVVLVALLALASTLGWGPFGQSGPANGDGSVASAGNDSGSGSDSSQTVTKEVKVDGMAFVPNRIEVPRGAHLVINFTNTGDQAHDLKIGGKETGRVKAGESASVDVGTVDKDMQGWCTIAGHKMQGMTLDVVASDTADDSAEESQGATGAGAVTPADLTADPGDGFEAFDPTLKPAPAGELHEYDWEITAETREVAPGKKQKRWLFNGQAPGPVLRAHVGDTFRLHLKNSSDEAQSFDFTGGRVGDDSTVEPGEEKTVEFTARHAGAWMYRSTTDPQALNTANGLFGAVLVDDNLPAVDKEIGLVGSEVYLAGDANPNKGADPDRVARGEADLWAFNAYPAQYLHDPIEVKKGESVRMWVLNAGPHDPLTFGVDGAVLDTVYADGRSELSEGRSAHALDLGPSQGGFVEMTFDEPGTYTFGSQPPAQADLGQRGTIVVR